VRGLIALVAAIGCAQPGIPPGGPTDTEPPRLVRVTPDTNQTNARGSVISFEFDEVVSERPQGVPGLAELFIVSPSRGPNSVSWRRTRVEISPRGGLQANTTYTVRMLPGMADLDNNVDSTGLTLVFSTGASLATGRITGRVFDWVTNRAVPRASVVAISLPDSTTYSARADSSGAFTIAHMPAGEFLLRALVDQNNNGVVDSRELFDTATVTLTDSLSREMLAAVRDSLGAGIATAELRDSLTVRLTMDRPLDTLFVAGRSHFSIRGADSASVAFDTVLTQADVDRQVADSVRRRAVQDSVRRAFAADSVRLADSASAANAPPTAIPPPRPTGRRPGAATGPPPVPALDSTTPIAPKTSARIPVTVLYVRLSRPLPGGSSFRIRADSMRSVTGAVRTSERVFTTPRPVVRPDTGQARPDTGAFQSRASRD
jgi:hypothetical protein